MNKGEGNFWTALLLGRMLSGKKGGSNNKGGCLSSIFGLIIIVAVIYLGMTVGIKGIIIGVIAAIAIIFILTYLFNPDFKNYLKAQYYSAYMEAREKNKNKGTVGDSDSGADNSNATTDARENINKEL